MLVKKFGEDFFHEDVTCATNPALTLSWCEVTDNSSIKEGVHTRYHRSGWIITGGILDDWKVWVPEFSAYHPNLGFINGSFEGKVFVSSEAAFLHFWEHHKPISWDYDDI